MLPRAGDEGAAKLLRALIGGGIPVVEAAAEEGRLERLFLDQPAGESGRAGQAAP